MKKSFVRSGFIIAAITIGGLLIAPHTSADPDRGLSTAASVTVETPAADDGLALAWGRGGHGPVIVGPIGGGPGGGIVTPNNWGGR